MKSEVEQSDSQENTLDRKTNSGARKSVTPSANMGPAQTPNLPSPSSSPAPDQSPRKPLRQPNERSAGVQGHGVNTGSENSVKHALSNKLRNQKAAQSKAESGKSANNALVSAVMETNKVTSEQNDANRKNKESNKKAVSTKGKIGPKEREDMETDEKDVVKDDEQNDLYVSGAHTPGTEMETDQNLKSHVRKINFDILKEKPTSQQQAHAVTIACSGNSQLQAGMIGLTKNIESASTNSDVLSKSTGFLNFKQLLNSQSQGDRKGQVNLNKSMGFLEKSSTTRGSAFVPVQSVSRKDNSTGNQSVAMAIPVIIPSAVTSQAVPGACVLPATALLPSELNAESAYLSGTGSLAQNQAKDSINIVTVTSVLSKMPASDIVVSSTQNSQVLARHTRSKFTPIRPKASPTKSSPAKDTKCETSQNYDNRPVAAILKEKRAKEQAEAIAKFQANLSLPTIQLQGNVPIATSQLSTLQTMSPSSAVPPSEVVFIVNNPSFVGSAAGTLVSQATVANSNLFPATLTSAGTGSAENVLGKEKQKHLQPASGGNDSNKKSVKFVTDKTDKKDSPCNILAVPDKADYSPMEESEGDITPILEERDSTPDIDLIDNAIEKPVTLRYPVQELGEESPEDKDDMNWSETPSKIAKLNINSPFRPESACSLGRETPVKITKCEPPLSRPESACSYGRETPSGARKRKSSESQARRDIKRLNSTGEEIDDLPNLAMVLSPENDNSSIRRTRSCTYELEKGCKGKSQNAHSQQVTQSVQQQQHHPQAPESKKTGVSLHGLQKPDINCLEREALIESFPNSLLAMRPGRSNRTQSVGVSAKSLKHSQQKLRSQHAALNERVTKYFSTKEVGKEDECNEVRDDYEMSVGPGSLSGRAIAKTDTGCQVVPDRGKPYVRPASVNMVSNTAKFEIEPSGLPSDVADWINEAIEKRQKENQSAQSEPDLHKNQRNRVKSVENFQFEVSPVIQQANGGNAACVKQLSQIPQEMKQPVTVQKSDKNTFTVPKAPPVGHQRQRDHGMRLNTEQVQNNQRCHSLPIFASPAQSPVSPVSPLGSNHGYQRALSMSPRGQPMEVSLDILSPTGPNLSPGSGLHSPDRNVQNQSQSFGSITRDSSSKVKGPYLTSIQQTLQKPADYLPRHTPPTPRDLVHEKTLLALQGHFQTQNTLQPNFGQNPLLSSRESSLEVDERLISQTPFSDSGYQSSGPSPILNSTPVSSVDNSDPGNMMKHSVAESPVALVTDFTSPIPQMSSNLQSPARQQLPAQLLLGTMTTNLAANQNQSLNGTVLRSSADSAFTPIQLSHDVRYVAPIKPTVTLPNSMSQIHSNRNTTNLFVDTNISGIVQDMNMVTQRAVDPPSYEMAIKHLQQTSSSNLQDSALGQDIGTNRNKSEQNPSDTFRDLANRNPEQQMNSLGPFAAKLKKLSQQTQNADLENDENFLDLLSPSSNTVAITTNTALCNIPCELPNVSLSVNIDQSLSFNQNEVINSKSANENSFLFNNNISGSGGILLYNACVTSSQRMHSQSVLDDKSAKNSNQTPMYLFRNTTSDSVLSIDPSFNLSPQSALTNQNSDNSMLPLSNESMLLGDTTDDQQMALSDNTELLKEFGLDLESFKEMEDAQYLNGTDDSQFDILMQDSPC